MQIGDGFKFSFDNKEDTYISVKKKSPSQEKRSLQRTLNFKKKQLEENIVENDTCTKEKKSNMDIKKELKKEDPKKLKFVGEYNSKDITTAGQNRFWKQIEHDLEVAIETFPDGSTWVENVIFFEGTGVMKPGFGHTYLEDLKNWPKGVRNLRIS